MMAVRATFLAMWATWVAQQVNAVSPNNQVHEFWMYRCTKDVQLRPYVLENVAMGDIPGALKYLHTEIITEHKQLEERQKRSYEIGIIARWRVLVSNPSSVAHFEDSGGVTRKIVSGVTGNFEDFGPFVSFEHGQATSNIQELEKYGDFVGVEMHLSNSWVFPDPFFWFSLSGFCPNLPYVCTNGWTGDETSVCNHDPPIHTSMCTVDDPCPSKGTRAHPQEDSGHQCSALQSSGPPKKVLQGGLCGNHDGHGHNVQLEEPTGKPGCVYSYNPLFSKKVELDDVVGITDEDCGGNKCKDWQHFRTSCTNSTYKKKYLDTIPPQLVDNYKYCVEYDIHPECEKSCSSPKCLQVPEEERELGLPFWKGRCDGRANMNRAEIIANAFEIPHAQDAHNILEQMTTKYDSFGTNKACVSDECSPDFSIGGPFCTREWGGVCTPCQIEGISHPSTMLSDSVLPSLHNDVLPVCPLNVISSSAQYRLRAQTSCKRGSCCSSASARDRCCLYFDACKTKLSDVAAEIDFLPLDEDSMVLVEATQDTDIILQFMKRIAQELGRIHEHVIEERTLRDIAYWSWGKAPLKGERLQAAQQEIQAAWPTRRASLPQRPEEDDRGIGGIGMGVISVVIIIVFVIAFSFLCTHLGIGKKTRSLSTSFGQELTGPPSIRTRKRDMIRNLTGEVVQVAEIVEGDEI